MGSSKRIINALLAMKGKLPASFHHPVERPPRLALGFILYIIYI